MSPDPYGQHETRIRGVPQIPSSPAIFLHLQLGNRSELPEQQGTDFQLDILNFTQSLIFTGW